MSSVEGVDPPYFFPGYGSSTLRAPLRPLLRIPAGPTELHGPDGALLLAAREGLGADLTRQHPDGEPLGQRIIVEGRILDDEGRPLPAVLVEIWQANASGRYVDPRDQHQAPLDPSFTGAGFCLTDQNGGYRFVTIKPGAYPWRNHQNAWRPPHIHVSVMGRSFSQRLLTQMYFPGDPLLALDPIFQAVPAAARDRLVSSFEISRSVPDWAMTYKFDIVLGGRAATPES